MWHAAKRAGWNVGRDQVTRLMKLAGICGVRRGRAPVTTRTAPVPDYRPELVNRCFKPDRPNQLWVADITYVHALSGFVYTAFVTDVHSENRGLVHQIDHDHQGSSAGSTRAGHHERETEP